MKLDEGCSIDELLGDCCDSWVGDGTLSARDGRLRIVEGKNL